MQLDFIENEHEKRAFMFSVGVVVLSVIAVITFAFTGGSIFFYIFAAIAIIFGFYMAWHISRPYSQPQARARTARKRSVKQ
jgi:uncharacterized membrane protein YfcA